MAFKELKNEAGVSLGYLQTDANDRLGIHNLLHVQHKESSGTFGGEIIKDAWRTIKLNHVAHNPLNLTVDIINYSMTLPAGSYWMEGTATIFNSSQTKLAIHDGSSIILIGRNVFARGTNPSSVNSNGGSASIAGNISLQEQKTIQLFIYTKEGYAGYLSIGGHPLSIVGIDEIYTDLKIWKVA